MCFSPCFICSFTSFFDLLKYSISRTDKITFAFFPQNWLMKQINYHLPKENCVKVMRASICFPSARLQEFVTCLIRPVKYRQIMIRAIVNKREIHAKHLGKIVWGVWGPSFVSPSPKSNKGKLSRVWLDMSWTGKSPLVCLFWIVFFGVSFL